MSRTRVIKIVFYSLLIAATSMILRSFMSSMSKIPVQTSTSKHAIVVGSGIAGLTAASQLVARGLPKYQPGPPFSDKSFYEDTVKSAGAVISIARKQRESLISTLTNSSTDAVSWLVDNKGIDLSVVAQLGGHSFPRTHRGAGQTPPGASIVLTLLKSLKESPLFNLETSCQVTKVLKDGSDVTGVQYSCDGQVKVLHGPIVFASGGFGGDAEGMLAQYRPDLAGFPSTNDPRHGSQSLLTEVGAQLLDMDLVQVHPTSFLDPKDVSNPVKFLAAEVLRGEGGLLLRTGKRFINEMETRKNVTDAITKVAANSVSPRQWEVELVLDEGVYNNASSHIDFYVWKGLMRKTTASELGVEAQSSIEEYAKAAAGHIVDPFGREYFGHWKLRDVLPDSVVYVGLITPAVHFTMGGVIISPHSEVLDASSKPIKGLWAAGEVTGGIHGENRLGGSSLLECVVFGKIAGEQAANYLEGI